MMAVSSSVRTIPENGIAALAGWLAAAVALAGLAAVQPAVAAGAAAGAAAVAAWRWPRAVGSVGAWVVLALRPSLDAFSVRGLGLSPFALDPSVIVGVAVLGLAAVLALRRARDGRRVWPDRTLLRTHVWLLAAYAIGFYSGSRLYGGAGFGEGAREMVRVASIIAAFLLVLWWAEADAGRYRLGWTALAVGAVIPVVVALGELVTQVGYREPSGLLRLEGTFSHPNAFGQYLAPFVLVAVGAAIAGRGAARLGSFAVAAALSVIVALTYSRTAILVVATGVAVLPLLRGRALGRGAVARAVIVVSLFIGLVWLIAGPYVEERFADISFGTTAWQLAVAGQSENSFQWRIINWGGLILLGMDHPLFGHGMGMTTQLNPLSNEENGLPFNAHNDFVRFFFETGLVGLICYVVYGLLLCSWALRQVRLAAPARGPTAQAVAAALLAMFFLTIGAPELSLNTASLYALYGMLALVRAGTPTPSPASSRPGPAR